MGFVPQFLKRHIPIRQCTFAKLLGASESAVRPFGMYKLFTQPIVFNDQVVDDLLLRSAWDSTEPASILVFNRQVAQELCWCSLPKKVALPDIHFTACLMLASKYIGELHVVMLIVPIVANELERDFNRLASDPPDLCLDALFIPPIADGHNRHNRKQN
jgi:hypothetical protein